MTDLKFSIITVTYNSVSTISDAICSVLAQRDVELQYIIIDGGSTDGTLDVVNRFSEGISIVVSEKDDGVYSAMNKGVSLATGDVIGFLNSDDMLEDENVLSRIKSVFVSDGEIDACFSDLVYVDKNDASKVIRYWKSSKYKPNIFSLGWVPAHPTFYAKKAVYDKFGHFDEQFQYASDYDLMMRYIEVMKISTHYIPRVTVRMRVGGKTNRSLKNIIRGNIEIFKICKKNHVKVSIFFLGYKFYMKLLQYINKNKYMPAGKK